MCSAWHSGPSCNRNNAAVLWPKHNFGIFTIFTFLTWTFTFQGQLENLLNPRALTVMPPHLTMWPWPLTSWPTKLIISCHYPMNHLCQLASKSVHLFICFHNIHHVDKDGRTDGQHENILLLCAVPGDCSLACVVEAFCGRLECDMFNWCWVKSISLGDYVIVIVIVTVIINEGFPLSPMIRACVYVLFITDCCVHSAASSADSVHQADVRLMLLW